MKADEEVEKLNMGIEAAELSELTVERGKERKFKVKMRLKQVQNAFTVNEKWLEKHPHELKLDED
jgi:hypothetical protein